MIPETNLLRKMVEFVVGCKSKLGRVMELLVGMAVVGLEFAEGD